MLETPFQHTIERPGDNTFGYRGERTFSKSVDKPVECCSFCFGWGQKHERIKHDGKFTSGGEVGQVSSRATT